MAFWSVSRWAKDAYQATQERLGVWRADDAPVLSVAPVAEAPADPGAEGDGSRQQRQSLAATLRSRGGAADRPRRASVSCAEPIGLTAEGGNDALPGSRRERRASIAGSAFPEQPDAARARRGGEPASLAGAMQAVRGLFEEPARKRRGSAMPVLGGSSAQAVPTIEVHRAPSNKPESMQASSARSRLRAGRLLAPPAAPAADARHLLKQQLKNFARTRGYREAPRLVSVKSLSQSAAQASPSAMEASVLWRGVEILLGVSSAPFAGGGVLVTSARTRCSFEGFADTVEQALQESARARTLEAFLDALAAAWDNFHIRSGGREEHSSDHQFGQLRLGLQLKGLDPRAPELQLILDARPEDQIEARVACFDTSVDLDAAAEMWPLLQEPLPASGSAPSSALPTPSDLLSSPNPWSSGTSPAWLSPRSQPSQMPSARRGSDVFCWPEASQPLQPGSPQRRRPSVLQQLPEQQQLLQQQAPSQQQQQQELPIELSKKQKPAASHPASPAGKAAGFKNASPDVAAAARSPPSGAAWSCFGEEEEEEFQWADWLDMQPPRWRARGGTRGLGWDFPPTRAEASELLVLSFLAEEAARDAWAVSRKHRVGGA